MTDPLIQTIMTAPLTEGQRRDLLALIRDGNAEEAKRLYELWTGKEVVK